MVEFETDIPEDILQFLYDLGSDYEFDPISSFESEKYFISLLDEFKTLKGSELFKALSERVQQDFVALNGVYPDWIQSSDWQFNDGKPMIFIGQLEKDYNKLGISSAIVFYIFYDKETGDIKSVSQFD